MIRLFNSFEHLSYKLLYPTILSDYNLQFMCLVFVSIINKCKVYFGLYDLVYSVRCFFCTTRLLQVFSSQHQAEILPPTQVYVEKIPLKCLMACIIEDDNV